MHRKASLLSTTRPALGKVLQEGSIFVDLTKGADRTGIPRSANFAWFYSQDCCRIFVPDAHVEVFPNEIRMKAGGEWYVVQKECVMSIQLESGGTLWPVKAVPA